MTAQPARNLLVALGIALLGCASSRPVARDEPNEPAEEATASKRPTENPPAAGEAHGTRPLSAPRPMFTIVQADHQKPIVSVRLVFRAGSVSDPPGKEGLTALTATLMQEGGTQELSSAELLQALFPLAGEISVQSDKELTAFYGRVHKDNVDRFFKIFADILLEPRFDPRDFERIRTDALNRIRNQLRGQDDETLGKTALESLLYPDHPYRHFEGGTVAGLAAISLPDVVAHRKKVFSQDRLVIGLSGPVDAELEQRVKQRLSALPATGAPLARVPAAPAVGRRALILEKDVLSTAVSMGYIYPLRRGDPDFYPLAFALSYLGEHRQSQGVLFRELRERRGLNYGDYAYPERFIQEGVGTLPLTNAALSQQYFSIWIRPVEPANAVFATRAALYFLDQLVSKGIPRDAFEVTRGFLTGYSLQWDQTDQRKLGYAIDELFYGAPDYLDGFRRALAQMSPEDVQRAVKRHLTPERLSLVFVAKDARKLAAALASGAPSPISYPTPKPEDVFKEDRAIVSLPLRLDASSIQIADAQKFMEQ